MKQRLTPTYVNTAREPGFANEATMHLVKPVHGEEFYISVGGRDRNHVVDALKPSRQVHIGVGCAFRLGTKGAKPARTPGKLVIALRAGLRSFEKISRAKSASLRERATLRRVG